MNVTLLLNIVQQWNLLYHNIKYYKLCETIFIHNIWNKEPE